METNIGRLRREKPPKGACGSATGGRERHDYRRIRAKIALYISRRGALYWRAYPETEHERLPFATCRQHRLRCQRPRDAGYRRMVVEQNALIPGPLASVRAYILIRRALGDPGALFVCADGDEGYRTKSVSGPIVH